MSDDDPGRLADQLDRQAGDLEKRSRKLSDQIEDVGQDWERKRGDASVPGAPPDLPGEGSEGEDGDSETSGNPPQGDTAAGSGAGEGADDGEDDGGREGEEDRAQDGG